MHIIKNKSSNLTAYSSQISFLAMWQTITSIPSTLHEWELEGNFESWTNESILSSKKGEFMHDIVPLFIGERYSFVWNYKYGHKACTYGYKWHKGLGFRVF